MFLRRYSVISMLLCQYSIIVSDEPIFPPIQVSAVPLALSPRIYVILRYPSFRFG